MKNRYILFWILLAALIFQVQAYAQVDKVAQAGMKWLSIPIGARATALGGAYTASTPDAGSAFWNPAGLSLLDGNHVFLSQTQWIANINVNAAAVSFSLGDIGTFGVHAIAMDWGTFHGTEFTGDASLFRETGEFTPDDFAVGVTYSRQVSDKFSFGGGIKFLHENLGNGLEGSFDAPEEYSAELNAVALDFGTLFYTGFKDLRLAMSIRNVSQEKKYRFESFPLPLTFKFGAAMNLANLFMDTGSDQKVTFSLDAINERDFSERVHFGLEYAFKDLVFLRGGYKTNYDEEDLAFGGGVHVNVSNFDLTVDYSYLQFNNFDAVHSFSFDFGF